eukprot:TCONS_00067160-protein
MGGKIPDNVKMDLRSVLLAASGTMQSKLAREYYDIMGEHLPIKSLGFKNIYEFLLALEGDVCRMEFSLKNNDNIVFAILDNTSFTSEHAKKAAAKTITGSVPHKSPEEIALISDGQPVGKLKPSRSDRKNKNNGGFKRKSPKKMELPPQPIQTPMGLPNQFDWNRLNQLTRNTRGEYTLIGRLNGIRNDDELRRLFSGIPIKYIGKSNNSCFISFSNYLLAFSAWMKMLLNHPMFDFAPSIDREMRWLSTSHKIMARRKMIKKLHLVNVVQFFSQNATEDLYMIETRYNMREAVAYYKTREAAMKKCSNGRSSIKCVDNQEVLVELSMINAPQPVSMASITNTLNNIKLITQPPPLMQQPALPGLLPTPSQRQFHKQHTVYEVADERPGNSSPTPTEAEKALTEEEQHIESYMTRRCGFILNYRQSNEMFKVTCKRSARTARNVADQIDFIVSHVEDGCRFWIMVIDQQRTNFNKLMEIEQALSESSQKIQPPSIKPKPGTRGCALFSESQSSSPRWYRCYVLQDKEDEDCETITVFYVDWGNIDNIPFENFRNTYPDQWKLPPQAIPCKIHGLEMARELSASKREQSRDNLRSVFQDQMMKATVVKDAEYSQPHIVELKELCTLENNQMFDVSEFCLSGMVRRIGSEEQANEESDDSWNEFYSQEDEKRAEEERRDEREEEDEREEDGASTTSNKSSLFPYNFEQLVFGMVSEVHNANLIYLQLGNLTSLNDLERELLNLQLSKNEGRLEVNKGGTFLYSGNGLRRRVMVLEADQKSATAKVLHVDYGAIEWVQTRQLHNLETALKNRHFQARPTALAGLKYRSVSDVTSYVKDYVKKLIRALVVQENENGKLFVELFDAETGASLNKLLIQRGLADPASSTGVDGNERDETASVISVPRHAKQVPQSSSASSAGSLDCKAKQQTVPIATKNNYKAEDVKTWVDQHSPPKESEEWRYRPSTPPFPPPDIVSSNTVKASNNLKEGVQLEGRTIKLGEGESNELHLTEGNKLDSEEVEALQKRWGEEKKSLMDVQDKLQHMLSLAPEELKEAFKEKKKEKLLLMLRMKNLRAELKKVETEYSKVVQDTEDLLASI